MTKRLTLTLALIGAALLLYGCASITGTGMVQAPRVRSSAEHPSEISLSGPGHGTLRTWARVKNLNNYPVTLSKIHGALYLGGSKAGIVNLEPAIQMKGREEKTVPLDLEFKGKESKGAAEVTAEGGAVLPFRLDAVLTVTAGERLEPTFGPITLLEGQARVR